MSTDAQRAGGRAENATLVRPDPQDIVYSELNLERWPGLWATRDTEEPRSLSRSLRYPDGSTLDVSLTVSAPPGTGTLTTETQRYYTALLKMRQDLWGPDVESAPKDRRMLFTLRGLITRFMPGDETVANTNELMDDVGEIVEVVATIGPGEHLGRVAFRDINWNAIGDGSEIEKGKKVRIVSRDNITLVVEPAYAEDMS